MNFLTRCVLTLCFAFGAVLVGDAAGAAESISKVNGSVKVEPGQQAGDVDTVNGSITIGADAVTHGRVEAVNGSVILRRGARVAGGLENVNGTMTLEGAQVDGGIATVNGDIRLAPGTRLSGGIRVEESKSWRKGGNPRNPRITIEQGVVIEGPFNFEREVDLYVAPGVTVPPVEGVAPRRLTL